MYNKYTYIYNQTLQRSLRKFSAIKLNLIPEYQFCVYLYFRELSIQDILHPCVYPVFYFST